MRRTPRTRVRPLAGILTLVLVGMLMPTAGHAAAATTVGFTDLDSVHAEDIRRVVAAGLSDGCATDRYCPDDPVTRGQIASFLAAALHLPAQQAPFVDVPLDGVHASSIGALTAAGITKGCDDDEFCPTRHVTRGEVATLLARAYTLPAGAQSFVDVPAGAVHADGIAAVTAEGIAYGCTADRFCPTDAVTRGQLAALLSRTLQLDEAGCRPLDVGTVIADIGPVAPAFPVNSAVRLGDVLWVASLGLSPSRLVGYDLTTGAVTRTIQLPTGVRTWALTTDGRSLYVGQWNTPAGATNLYRVDPWVGHVRPLATLDTGGEFWDLAVHDGVLYAGTAQHDRVLTYDLQTGITGAIAVAGPGAQVTQVEVGVDGVLWVGTGRGRASLHAVDLATRSSRAVQPALWADAIGIYDLTVADGLVVAGLQADPARLVVLDGSGEQVIADRAFRDESIIGGLSLGEGVVHAAGLRTGRLYQLVLGTGDARAVGLPVPWSPTRVTFTEGTDVIGVSAAPIVWVVDTLTAAVVRHDLVAAGAPAGPEAPQSVAVTPTVIVVGMNNAIQVRRREDPRDVVRHSVPGEVKAMLAVGEDVYLALYPSGELWHYDGSWDRLKPIADWEDVQDRPADLALSESGRAMYIATRSDFLGGGALVTAGVTGGSPLVWRDPLGAGIAVHSLAIAGSLVVLGGDAADDADAPLAAVDPATGTVVWQIVPALGAGGITGLLVRDGVIHVLTRQGVHARVTAADGVVLGEPSFVLGGEVGELAPRRDELVAVSREGLVRLSPTADTMTGRIVSGLAPAQLGRPRVRPLDACDLLVGRGRDLVRVMVDPRRR